MPETFDEKRKALFMRRRRIIAAILTLAVAFTGYFVYRTIDRARFFREHKHGSIRGWMTIRHIARTRDVSPRRVKEALGLDASVPERRTLVEIAREQDRSVEDLILSVEKAIGEERLKDTPAVPGGGP